MWTIIILILVCLYILYKAFIDQSIWAIGLTVIAIIALIIIFWDSILTILLGIVIMIMGASIINKILNKISEKDKYDWSFLKSELDKKPNNSDFKVTTDPNMQNKDVAAAEDDAYIEMLQYIKNVQDVIVPQLKDLGDKIDSSYNAIAQTVSDFGNLLINYSGNSISDRAKYNVAIGTAVISGLIDMWGKYKARKEMENQARKLLVQKKEIAITHMPKLKQLLPGMEDNLSKCKKLVIKHTHLLYDISTLNDDKKLLELLRNNMDKSLNIYRTFLYYDMISKYLYTEYDAWLSDYDQSSLLRPSMYDVNSYIASNILLSKDNLKTELNDCLEMGPTAKTIEGSKLMMINDPQLLAFAMLNNKGRHFGNEFISCNDTINKLLKSNSSYKEYSERYKMYQSRVETGRVKIPNIIYWCIPVLIIFARLFVDRLEGWVFVYLLSCIALAFALGYLANRTNRDKWLEEDIKILENHNSTILERTTGYIVKSRKKEEWLKTKQANS